MSDIVRVENVVKEFRPDLGWKPRRVLDGISFGVQEGEIFGFVGPNGAGKTTTLKVLMGLIRATSGSATILGHPVRSSEVHRHVGFLPENPWFYDFLTGREFLDFYARLSGVPRRERRERAETLLGWVGLSHAGGSRLRTYSKGMLQRIGIAQALVHDPAVVFLDEPMSGLDPIGRKEIRDLILRLRSEGKTVFMNTHILSDVEMVCDRVAIIVKGRIRHEGRIETFLDGRDARTEVVLSGVSPDLVERFEEQLDAEVRGGGDHIEFRIRQKDVEELLRTALDAGAEVRALQPHRASLESIFLHAVEEGRHAEPSGHGSGPDPEEEDR